MRSQYLVCFGMPAFLCVLFCNISAHADEADWFQQNSAVAVKAVPHIFMFGDIGVHLSAIDEIAQMNASEYALMCLSVDSLLSLKFDLLNNPSVVTVPTASQFRLPYNTLHFGDRISSVDIRFADIRAMSEAYATFNATYATPIARQGAVEELRRMLVSAREAYRPILEKYDSTLFRAQISHVKLKTEQYKFDDHTFEIVHTPEMYQALGTQLFYSRLKPHVTYGVGKEKRYNKECSETLGENQDQWLVVPGDEDGKGLNYFTAKDGTLTLQIRADAELADLMIAGSSESGLSIEYFLSPFTALAEQGVVYSGDQFRKEGKRMVRVSGADKKPEKVADMCYGWLSGARRSADCQAGPIAKLLLRGVRVTAVVEGKPMYFDFVMDPGGVISLRHKN